MVRARVSWAILVMGLGLGLACGGVGDLTVQTGNGGSTAAGVPCDVAQALTACVGCHGDPPIAGALGSLLTYADLTAPAPADTTRPPDPGVTMAQMALIRMQDTGSPMPPPGLPPATAAQIQALSSWIAAGTPMGTCGGSPDPTFGGPSICASGVHVPSGEDTEGPNMAPGRACIACHSQNEGPRFSIAGTVFAAGHVPSDCQPTAAQTAELTQAQVVVTDSDNQVFTLSVTSNGNFSRRAKSLPQVAFPITAKVVYLGKERAMLSPQTSGDCNGCHTDQGKSNAPGRIALPN
jgi:mono/diheme cytochrome c family protein